MTDSPRNDPDGDTYALASMIADHLRGIPINPAHLPPRAHRLVAAYVARHKYGGSVRLGRLGPFEVRFVARDHTGTPLPEVPDVQRGGPVVIDHDDDAAPHTTPSPAKVVSAPSGQPSGPVAHERNRHG